MPVKQEPRFKQKSSVIRWSLLGLAFFLVGVIIYFNLGGPMGRDARRRQAVMADKLSSKNFLTPIVVIDHKDTENNDLFLPLASLRSQLPKYLSDPQIGKPAQAVLARLSEYEEFAKQQFAAAAGMEIDYIGIYHIGGNDNDPVFRRSQAEQKELLEHYPYDIISWEGGSSDHVTWDSLADEAMVEAKNMGVTVTRQAIMGAVRTKIELDGVLMYYDQHLKANLTGSEDPTLLNLNVVIQELSGTSKARAAELEDLTRSVVAARSLIALARMINQMRLQNLRTGVVVMGYGHAQDFNILFGTLGTKSRIFAAI
jgi:hypothetical protein